MAEYAQSLAKLINEFSKLPGVGQKTAQRYAFSIINDSREEAKQLADAIMAVKDLIHRCPVCGNYTDSDRCEICAQRSARVICVVKDAKDILALEKAKDFDWSYHVLNGTISPLNGIMPEHLNIQSLLKRIQEGKTEELVLALNPDIEGDATAMYLAQLIKPLGVKVTRLACGLQAGSDIEYADNVTLAKAFADRREM